MERYAHIIVTEVAQLETDPKITDAAHFISSVNKGTQILRHKHVKKKYDQNPKLDWKSTIQLLG